MYLQILNFDAKIFELCGSMRNLQRTELASVKDFILDMLDGGNQTKSVELLSKTLMLPIMFGLFDQYSPTGELANNCKNFMNVRSDVEKHFRNSASTYLRNSSNNNSNTCFRMEQEHTQTSVSNISLETNRKHTRAHVLQKRHAFF